MALLDRARSVVSAESDNFFNDDTIVFYLNRSLENVVSYGINKELNVGKNINALDLLRSNQTIALGSFTKQDSYYKGTVTKPTDLYYPFYLKYKDSVVLRSISPLQLYMLEWGNLVPSEREGYFVPLDSSEYTLYLHEDGNSNDLNVFYIKNPSTITSTTDSISDLPNRLENAVIYGSAVLMLAQEINEQGSVSLFQSIYDREIQTNLF